MKIKLDSLVRGAPGMRTDRTVEGRVFYVSRSGAVTIICEEGKQWMIYKPELIAGPRPVNQRSDIPTRLR